MDSKKVKFSVKDRLVVANLYPKQSSLTDQLLVRDITEKVKFTQEELVAIELKNQNGALVWNAEKGKDIEVEFSALEISLLKDLVMKLDNEKAVTTDLVDVCMKIKNS